MAYRRPFSMRANASLCGATICRDRPSGRGRGYRAFSAPSGLCYARYCKRTSQNTPSPSVGIELARRHGSRIVNRTVREHEDGPTPPPRSARPPRSRIVSGGPGPVHAPFGPFRPARERRGARKSPAARTSPSWAAGLFVRPFGPALAAMARKVHGRGPEPLRQCATEEGRRN